MSSGSVRAAGGENFGAGAEKALPGAAEGDAVPGAAGCAVRCRDGGSPEQGALAGAGDALPGAGRKVPGGGCVPEGAGSALGASSSPGRGAMGVLAPCEEDRRMLSSGERGADSPEKGNALLSERTNALPLEREDAEPPKTGDAEHPERGDVDSLEKEDFCSQKWGMPSSRRGGMLSL